MAKGTLVLIAAHALAQEGRFFRLGREWTTEGTVVSADDFTADEWRVLDAERMLVIGPAPEGAEANGLTGDDQIAAIKAAFQTLGADDFDDKGAPKLAAMKERLPELKKLTGKMVAELWAEVSPTA